MARLFAPVPAIPPKPPGLGLLASAIRPTDTERWQQGFTWAPENRYQAELRDACDGTTVDAPALNAPTGLVAVPAITGGTLAAATYSYQLTAVNANGQTTALPAVTATVLSGTTGSVALTWPAEADGLTYKVYGRVAGSIGLLATVGPFDPDNPPAYTDTGTPAPGAAVPGSNTTGGPGNYGNAPVQQVVPPLIVVEDSCSAWGWQERDFKGRATRLLENAESQALEREFWTGTLATAFGYPNHFLADGTAVDVTPGTVPSVERGMQLLAEALAQCGFGGRGMIHCMPAAHSNLINVRREGALLYDIQDNIIVPGAGYPGTGPANAVPSAGQSWMFATDLVAVRSDETVVFPDTFAEALDRGQAGQPNTIRFRAEKLSVAYCDFTCAFACRVTLPA